MKYAALIAAGMVVVGGTVFASVEKVDQHQHALTSWDGIWWVFTTVTTVGYGDMTPHTDAGRVIAMTIMVVGIGFVALLTAFVADRFIHQQRATETKADQILAELREIRARLNTLPPVELHPPGRE